MSARLIDLIADHIRRQRSGSTIIEIDEERQTVVVDGVPIGKTSDQTITIKFPTSYDGDLVLDARNPDFFNRLDWALADKLDDHFTISQRRAYREQKEVAWRSDFFKWASKK